MIVLDKYLQGTIYTNYLYEGLSSLITIPIVKYLYEKYKMRQTLIISSAICVVGSISTLIVESFADDPKSKLFSHKQINKLVPICGFITKLGIYMIMNTSMLASYTSDAMFPLAKRSTAVGIVSFLGVLFTILAPIIGEAAAPLPLLSLTVFNIICFMVSFTFPSKEEEEEIESIFFKWEIMKDNMNKLESNKILHKD